MKTFVTILALAGVLPAHVPAARTDAFATLIAAADSSLRKTGFRPAGWQHRHALGAKGSELIKLGLAGTDPVQVIGMCDGDCANLDLELLDAAGHGLDRDAEPDDFPIVSADEGGSYSIRVTMRRCDRPTCSYVLRAYAKS